MNSIRCLQMMKKLVPFGNLNYGSRVPNVNPVSNFSSLTSSITTKSSGILSKTVQFLTPITCNLMPVCGMKAKGKVRKRCKACYMVYKDHRVFNFCKVKPKHNQMNIVEKASFYFKITERTHGRIRKY